MVRAEYFRLANGWTVSLSEDTPPALCSIAAWPGQGDAPRDQATWLDFGDGRRERRCWNLEDLVEALRLVAETAPPEG